MRYFSGTCLILTVAVSCKSSGSGSSTESALIPANTASYPKADLQLGEEIHPAEMEAAVKIPALIKKQLNEKYAGKRILRDAHPKSHGCVNAIFRPYSGIRPEFAKGVFSPGGSFRAVVRYSNSNSDSSRPDIEGDGRGMAIKLMQVPGSQFLSDESSTQDFIMINHPVFFIADPEAYISLIEKSESSNIFSKISSLAALGFKGAKIASDIRSKKISSPIQTAYFSEVPYQLGVGKDRRAVRYKAEPCAFNGNYEIPGNTDDADFLRHRLIEHFKKSDACFDIYAQERTSEDMSVEDSRDEWDSPWSKVAQLEMKASEQDIAGTPDFEDPRNIACDNLSFSPWHSLPDHKPLGVMNRLRKGIYEQISAMRRSANK